jgi:hypothetical protein
MLLSCTRPEVILLEWYVFCHGDVALQYLRKVKAVTVLRLAFDFEKGT